MCNGHLAWINFNVRPHCTVFSALWYTPYIISTLCRVNRKISPRTYYHYTRPVAHEYTHTHYYNIILLIISRPSVLLYNIIYYINKAAAIAEHNTLIFVYFVGFALKKKKKTKPHSNLSPSLSSSLATFTAFAADDVQVRIYKYTTVESLMRLERK